MWVKMCVCTALQQNSAACWPSEKSSENHSRFTDTIQRCNKMVHFHLVVKRLTFMFTGALCYL